MSKRYQSVVHLDGVARRITLGKASNFRDLGGFKTLTGTTKFGRLFRSDQLGLLTPDDISVITEELKIAQVVDLRGEDELEIAGKGPLSKDSRVDYYHLAVSQVALAPHKSAKRKQLKNSPVSYRYFKRLMQEASSFKKILTFMYENPSPTVFNCVAGRDRTGLIAMLLLGAAGVCYEDIADDYAATARVPVDERDRSLDPVLVEFWKDYIKATGSTFLKTPEEMVEAMLELLQLLDDDFGDGTTESGVLGYLTYLDVPTKELKTLLF